MGGKGFRWRKGLAMEESGLFSVLEKILRRCDWGMQQSAFILVPNLTH